MLRWFIGVVLLLSAHSLARAAEPSPYRLAEPFLKLPDGIKLGAVSAVATDSKGDLFVFHRAEPPILVFHSDGTFVRSFGDKLFVATHGLRIDADDNVWCTDMTAHFVVKFSHAGKVLMTLGEKGVPGNDEKHFNRPTDVAFGRNGNVFISDGYGNSRVVKFDKTGKFLARWGTKGKGDGQFNLPHAIRINAAGEVLVADRENQRIQVFDQDGKYLRQFGGFFPYGLSIAADGSLFIADGRACRVMKLSPDGKELTHWGIKGTRPGDFHMPHGIAVGPDGTVYVGEVDGKRVQRFVAEKR
jgi:DNA-binding beta-propeller fold protein YncE